MLYVLVSKGNKTGHIAKGVKPMTKKEAEKWVEYYNGHHTGFTYWYEPHTVELPDELLEIANANSNRGSGSNLFSDED